MKMHTKALKVSAMALSVVMIAASFAACDAAKDSKYLEKVDSYTFWENDASQAISQPNIGKMVEEFLNSDSNGKAKKVAFIGYDGCRADVLINALKSGATDKDGNDLSGHNEDGTYSALAKIKNDGGKLYIAHAGGYTGEETEQHCSTAPGWSALLTGVWGIDNGITDNGMPKNMDYKTFLLKAAEDKGMKTTFAASWEPHFTENYTAEIDYLKQHPDIPMNFEQVADDVALHEYLLSCVQAGSPNEKDIIFGIYEGTDHNGHGTGFSNDNYRYIKGFRDEDEMAYELLAAIESRPTYAQEDWLIVLTTDHGGIHTWHGGQSLEERTTWVVCNKPIDAKYYSQGYDGYNLKK